MCPKKHFNEHFWQFGIYMPKVWKWVSDAYPVNMGQMDHYVVFGTNSGAFQRGTKCSIGVNQTPLDPC